jgi:hypothetical protein
VEERKYSGKKKSMRPREMNVAVDRNYDVQLLLVGHLCDLALLSRRADACVVLTSLRKIVPDDEDDDDVEVEVDIEGERCDEDDEGADRDGAKGASGMLTTSPPLSSMIVGTGNSCMRLNWAEEMISRLNIQRISPKSVCGVVRFCPMPRKCSPAT